MVVKGRYVGQIKYDFVVKLDEKNLTIEEYKEYLKKYLNNCVYNDLGKIWMENSDDLKTKLTVTQQYLDAYEVQEGEGNGEA